MHSTTVAAYEAAKRQLDTLITADLDRVSNFLDFMVAQEQGG